MKKNFVRIVAALLVAMLALTLIPLGAMAAEPIDNKRGVWVQKAYGQGTSIYDYYVRHLGTYGSPDYYAPGSTIKTSTYDKLLTINGKQYDFVGFEDIRKYDEMKSEASNKIDKSINWNDPDASEQWKKLYEEWQKETTNPFYNKDVKIPGENATQDEIKAFMEQWGYNSHDVMSLFIFAAYVPHSHKLSSWISDGTTHWRNCLVCGENFIYQTWCQDGDEDETCNVCGGHVPYHDVTVIESEGGTITVNRDNASHRMKITADVQADDGYTLKELHFVKVRDDGSRQEVVRRQKDGQFYTSMPTYALEVSAEFVKN